MTEENNFTPETERTEEVQSIVERMPTRFGVWITAIVIFIFTLLAFFGWAVRYPDIVTGQIVISANRAPLKLVSGSSGRLRLNHIKSMQKVDEGQILAYIENPTNLQSVLLIDSLIKKFNPNTDNIIGLYRVLPKNISLGELNAKYYILVNALQDFINYKQDKMYDKQDEGLKKILTEQQKAITSATQRARMGLSSLSYYQKFYTRDSTLFKKKIISESELDKSQMTYISGKDAYQNSLNNLINSKQAAQQTESKIQDLSIQKPEREKAIRISLLSSYNDLVDNIKSWEQKYIFKSPYKGKVQFLKFYIENQFIQNEEPVFTIVPQESAVAGQVILPAQGSGKIKTGQEVIVKLDNYPYMEYGSIKGKINSISLTASVTKTEKNDIDTYMVLVDFPNQLKTNYGVKLDFKAEAKGSAEIITNDRRLIERLFDNLKYSIKR